LLTVKVATVVPSSLRLFERFTFACGRLPTMEAVGLGGGSLPSGSPGDVAGVLGRLPLGVVEVGRPVMIASISLWTSSDRCPKRHASLPCAPAEPAQARGSAHIPPGPHRDGRRAHAAFAATSTAPTGAIGSRQICRKLGNTARVVLTRLVMTRQES